MRFLFLRTYATSYNFYSSLLYIVKMKGGKPDKKTSMILYGHEFGFRSRIRRQFSRISWRDLQEYMKSYKGVQGTFYRNSREVVHKLEHTTVAVNEYENSRTRVRGEMYNNMS
jgi:hypothetical protein